MNLVPFAHARALCLLILLGLGNRVHVVHGVWKCPGGSCGELKAPGTFKYPESGNYDKDIDCTWTLNAPEGQRLKIVFTRLELQDGDHKCDHDYIEVLTSDGTLLTKVCEEPVPPISHVDNVLKLRFVSDSSDSGQGFTVKFDPHMDPAIVTTCGGQLLPGDSLKLPEGSEQKDCTWSVTAPQGQVMEARFINFETASSERAPKERCNSNYLKIWPLAPSEFYSGTYCGSLGDSSLARVVSSSRTMKLKLHTVEKYGEIFVKFSAIDPSSVVVQSFVNKFEHHPGDVVYLRVSVTGKDTLRLPYGSVGQVIYEPEAAKKISAEVQMLNWRYQRDEIKYAYIGGSANQSWVVQYGGAYHQDGSGDLESTKSSKADSSWECQQTETRFCGGR